MSSESLRSRFDAAGDVRLISERRDAPTAYRAASRVTQTVEVTWESWNADNPNAISDLFAYAQTDLTLALNVIEALREMVELEADVAAREGREPRQLLTEHVLAKLSAFEAAP